MSCIAKMGADAIFCHFDIKFMFSKKATKIDKIFTVNLTLCSKCQFDGEYFFNFVAFLKNLNFNVFHYTVDSGERRTFLPVIIEWKSLFR